MNSNMYSMNNFDFLARSFARMQAEGHPVDIQAITGNMDEEHRSWFCKRYALYPAGDGSQEARTGTLTEKRALRPVVVLLLRID